MNQATLFRDLLFPVMERKESLKTACGLVLMFFFAGTMIYGIWFAV
jgi:hypothetical protein